VQSYSPNRIGHDRRIAAGVSAVECRPQMLGMSCRSTSSEASGASKVLDEVADRRLAVLADRGVQADRLQGGAASAPRSGPGYESSSTPAMAGSSCTARDASDRPPTSATSIPCSRTTRCSALLGARDNVAYACALGRRPEGAGREADARERRGGGGGATRGKKASGKQTPPKGTPVIHHRPHPTATGGSSQHGYTDNNTKNKEDGGTTRGNKGNAKNKKGRKGGGTKKKIKDQEPQHSSILAPPSQAGSASGSPWPRAWSTGRGATVDERWARPISSCARRCRSSQGPDTPARHSVRLRHPRSGRGAVDVDSSGSVQTTAGSSRSIRPRADLRPAATTFVPGSLVRQRETGAVAGGSRRRFAPCRSGPSGSRSAAPGAGQSG